MPEINTARAHHTPSDWDFERNNNNHNNNNTTTTTTTLPGLGSTQFIT